MDDKEQALVATEPAPDRTLPSLPGYALLERIGEGASGQVYRATQLALQRTVAIKLLDPLPDAQAFGAALQREARLMAALAHPHIVTVYDFGQVGDRCFLVMEHVEGRSLRALMRPGRPWPVRRAWRLLDGIAGALSYIHARGVLHLDLKPENVLCLPSGDAKITDFGVAHARLDTCSHPDFETGMGSIDYCPPEQRHGLPIDQRADLFALATLAYELFTGQLPGRVYVPASRRNPQLRAGVDRVLRRALARDPDERYATVEAFRADLRRELERLSRLALWGIAAVAGVTLMLFLLRRLDTPRPAPQLPPTPLKTGELDSTPAGARRSLTIAPGLPARVAAGLMVRFRECFRSLEQ